MPDSEPRQPPLHPETASGDEYSAEVLLIATSSRYRRLGVPGESDLHRCGRALCATCDGPFYKGGTVAVVGSGNSAAEESLLLTKFADRVTILVRGDAFTASQVIRRQGAGDRGPSTCSLASPIQEFLGKVKAQPVRSSRSRRRYRDARSTWTAPSSSSASTPTPAFLEGAVTATRGLHRDRARPGCMAASARRRAARPGAPGDERAGHLRRQGMRRQHQTGGRWRARRRRCARDPQALRKRLAPAGGHDQPCLAPGRAARRASRHAQQDGHEPAAVDNFLLLYDTPIIRRAGRSLCRRVLCRPGLWRRTFTTLESAERLRRATRAARVGRRDRPQRVAAQRNPTPTTSPASGWRFQPAHGLRRRARQCGWCALTCCASTRSPMSPAPYAGIGVPPAGRAARRGDVRPAGAYVGGGTCCAAEWRQPDGRGVGLQHQLSAALRPAGRSRRVLPRIPSIVFGARRAIHALMEQWKAAAQRTLPERAPGASAAGSPRPLTPQTSAGARDRPAASVAGARLPGGKCNA